MFGFTVKKKVETPAEQKLEEIKNILFPPSETRESVDKDSGDVFKLQIEYSADWNLEGALTDIREGYADEVVQNTIKDIVDRIIKIRKILDAHAQIDSDAKYIIVDNKKEDLDIEAYEGIDN